MSKAELYDQRTALIKAAINHEKVDHVPVLSMAQTWAIDYAGTDAKDTFSSVEREFEVYSKHLLDFGFDGTCLFGMNRPIPMYEALGFSPFFYSKDGVTLQHMDNSVLPENEISEYIENPVKYLRNKALYRRFPALQQEFPNDMQALAGALQLMMAHKGKLDAIPGYLREYVGVPMLCGDLVEPAFDRYIGYRGFQNGMSDLRRRPEQVLEAVEATYPMVVPAPLPKNDFPLYFFPVVTATYLNRKNFEKFFWPTAKRCMESIIATGGKVAIALEGTWNHVYDHLLELPKGSVVACIEGDDFIQAKKDLGDKVTLCGGMPVQLLREGTKQQNIDHVRNIIDTCGMEGILLTQSQGLLSPGDVNPENLKAVVDFVKTYTV